ncbi:MAG: hypothetical protein ACRD2B_08305 [Terriglobia bacterium]
MKPDLKTAVTKLLSYCQAANWAGYDPYDALNSRLLTAFPFFDARLPRLVLTQALKRSPVNLRRLLLIPKTQNPKALALFLSAFVKLAEIGLTDDEGLVELMIDRLTALRSPGLSHWCWGYSFPWQGRAVLVPAGAPNLVSTTFAANALLDAYERVHDSRCLRMAASAGQYLLDRLYWTDGGSLAGFSYPLPSVRSQTHNANFLAAALLCRLDRITGEEQFLAPALRVARFSAQSQLADGSWYYGEGRSQRWIDNFHTGYNLCALRAIAADAGTAEFDSCIQRGFEFYRAHFFRPDGSVRYFHNREYPVDVHCVAQSVITLLAFRDLDPENIRLAHSVFQWAVSHMWDDRGFFYYRVHRFGINRTSYMRWSQAWMLLALSMLLAESNVAAKQPQSHVLAPLEA